eukprot:m.110192 g.110192  ORF g.110192 m.110192 type:complete len:304 (+) comp15908_c6_seq2:874-1785(+)
MEKADHLRLGIDDLSVSSSLSSSSHWALVEGLPFEVKEMEPGVFRLRERYYVSENRANIYFLQGSKMDLVIDTGLGLWDLPAFLRQTQLATEGKPILAVATHVHFDHAGGLHQFKQAAIHERELAAMASGDDYQAVTCLTHTDIKQPPSLEWKAHRYHLTAAPSVKPLVEGHVISLGDRRLEVLHVPGHSPGSIALFERKRGLLFSGDAMYDGAAFDWLPHSSVQDYVSSCQRLAALAGLVRRVYPGHFHDFSGQQLAALCFDYRDRATLWHRAVQKCFSVLASVVLRTLTIPGARLLCPCCT